MIFAAVFAGWCLLCWWIEHVRLRRSRRALRYTRAQRDHLEHGGRQMLGAMKRKRG